jgi:hypothetical protein
LLAPRDAGLPPAPRLPGSRLTWRGLTISERSLAGTHGQIGAALTLSAVRSGGHSFHSQADSRLAFKRWGRGGGGQRGHVSYGPQVLDSHEEQDQNPHGLDGEAGSGATGHL